MKALDDFVARLPNPKPLPKHEELRRVRLQITGMHELAVNAAEAKMPGFQRTLEWLIKKEERLANEYASEIEQLNLPL